MPLTAQSLVSISGWRTKIPQAKWHSQKKKRTFTPSGILVSLQTRDGVAPSQKAHTGQGRRVSAPHLPTSWLGSRWGLLQKPVNSSPLGKYQPHPCRVCPLTPCSPGFPPAPGSHSLLTPGCWPRTPRPEPSPTPAPCVPTALSDPAAKENCMMHLLRSLPDPNLITFLFLLEHLKR